MAFRVPEDIANRACQHLGIKRISSFADTSRQAIETAFVYPDVRRAELRRAVWNFSVRRMLLRKLTTTSVRVVFPTYSATTAYTAGDIVIDSTGFVWIALAGSTGVVPGADNTQGTWVAYFGQQSADTWSSTSAYYPGDLVVLSGVVYLCIAQTTNNTPPNTTYWHPPQGATTAAQFNISPIGYSRDLTVVRSAFVLPANYMRMAPQDRKQPGTARLNVTAGLKWNDWEIEAGLLLSETLTSPFVLRFVADTTDVTSMDDMFCEGLGAAMAMELNEFFTQSPDKFDKIGVAYERAITTGRLVGAIEAGTTEEEAPPAQPAGRQNG